MLADGSAVAAASCNDIEPTTTYIREVAPLLVGLVALVAALLVIRSSNTAMCSSTHEHFHLPLL